MTPALFAIWKGRGLKGGHEDRLPAVVEGESVSRAARGAPETGGADVRKRRGEAGVAHLLNLGSKSSAWLAAVGITDEAALRTVGAVEAYRRVKAAFPNRAGVLLLYALQGAIANVHWNEIPAELKRAMREEAQVKSRAGERAR